ncbi:6-phosphogluconolactonase [Rhodoluna sp. KAS3]|jgi:6-phosphogluconolactonase|uniref:6-phosphogluconolactonase n=1 Tax=Rhodoluna sp. KAS3 TaxID=942880 RepID=UPI0022327A9C|nr:6-phosphogluconolactonase [Rhodoluna sp. KAS3]BDS48996.1 6-phosphogluconolactonase [Rhodoluna sp. KAS3]
MSTRPFVQRFKDADSVARNAAGDLITKLVQLLEAQPEAHVMLTGGTVGIATLAALGEHEDKTSVDFTRVHFWWGDERFVASDSGDRNSLQARKALLSKISVDESKVHEFPASDAGLSLDEAAQVFAQHVDSVAPKFDVVFLGIGPDGHIASLFPGKPTPAAGAQIIAEHDSPKPPPMRLSFTYDALNAADEIWFVVAGADKQDAVAVAFGDEPETLPVGRVHGSVATRWYLDNTAGTKVFGC